MKLTTREIYDALLAPGFTNSGEFTEVARKIAFKIINWDGEGGDGVVDIEEGSPIHDAALVLCEAVAIVAYRLGFKNGFVDRKLCESAREEYGTAEEIVASADCSDKDLEPDW